MVLPLTYRRPSHVESSRSSVNGSARPASIGESFKSNSTLLPGIPEALSFDNVISGGTCPPCTTRDFMNYLIYIEHSAENLQFFLWYQDYVKRFSALPAGEQVLSPQWKGPHRTAAETNATGNVNPAVKMLSPETAAIFKDTDFAQPKTTIVELGQNPNPFNTPPKTPDRECATDRPSDAGWEDYTSTVQSSSRARYAQNAADAYQAADVRLLPFTIQPFREEIELIIGTYVSEAGPRQLNLASKERTELLKALSVTTHPSALSTAIQTVEWSLRHQAHPNFIRWTICNGNRPRVVFARGLGIGGIVGGIVTALLITLSSANRGWRAISALLLIIGISTLIAAWKGMCVVLHGMHHRHLRPWELFADEEDATSLYELKQESPEFNEKPKNSWETEPWVAKYERRNIIRKVFDREVWIQEPALRQIQDAIFWQAIICAVLGTAILEAIFVSVPAGNFI